MLASHVLAAVPWVTSIERDWAWAERQAGLSPSMRAVKDHAGRARLPAQASPIWMSDIIYAGKITFGGECTATASGASAQPSSARNWVRTTYTIGYLFSINAMRLSSWLAGMT